MMLANASGSVLECDLCGPDFEAGQTRHLCGECYLFRYFGPKEERFAKALADWLHTATDGEADQALDGLQKELASQWEEFLPKRKAAETETAEELEQIREEAQDLGGQVAIVIWARAAQLMEPSAPNVTG